MKKVLYRGMAASLALLTAISAGASGAAFQNAGFVNTFLGVDTGTVIGQDGDYTYTTAYTENGKPSDEGLTKLLADEDAFTKQIMAEGAVLLKNDGALPLTDTERKVTLFGRSTVDPAYRGSAAGGAVNGTSRLVNFEDAMTEGGFSLNTTLLDAYKSSETVRSIGAASEKNVVGEEAASFYTDSLKASFASYNDAAIVMFTRDGGEGVDAARVDSEGISYLALHQAEKDLLNMIYESNQFSKIILLINSPYPMELGDLDACHVNACLWIGLPGLNGFRGVPDLLTGAANPSGRLVDTYAADSLSSPAMANFGDYTFTGSDTNYVVETEGIYVGYKYYETRYEDAVLNRFNAKSSAGAYASQSEEWNYADEVVYPFGYGLSYTDFSAVLDSDSLSYNTDDDTYSVNATVTNTGAVAGKYVAELYAQAPYTDYDQENLVEKSAVTLVATAKTEELAPGESVSVPLTFDRYFLASFDTNGTGHYILDGGTYYFALGSDAHDALNNILAKKAADGAVDAGIVLTDANGNAVTGNAENCLPVEIGEAGTVDDETYRTSAYTGNEVTTAFTGREAIDINDFYPENVVTYLSRRDWEGTYPQTVALTSNSDIENALVARTYTKAANAKSVSDFTQGVDSGITFLDMKQAAFDDPRWDDFLNQLTIEDMASVLTDQGGNAAVETVSKPANKNVDGPDGVNLKYAYGSKEPATCYPAEVLIASTWSTDILSQFGNFYAEDMIYTGGNEAWGPGANIHRTPFGGRNFEYYSEDATLSYILSTAQVAAMTEKGIVVGIKHFSGNEQETNRSGVATFMTEQRFREISLRAFEGVFTKADCLGVMSAYNRVGCVNSALNKSLLTTILRDEWGFKGHTITDAAGGENETMPTVDCVVAGMDMFCIGSRHKAMLSAINDNDDGDLVEALRQANHRYYYAMARSTLVNGLSDASSVAGVTPWWQIACIAMIAIFGAATVVFTVLYIVPTKKPKKEGSKK